MIADSCRLSAGERVAAAAVACVRAKFRMQGRDPATGLDCIGVAAVAVGAVRKVPPPEGYALRTAAWKVGDIDGLVRCDGDRTGDVLLCRASPHQLHVAVRVTGGVVHADAGLRRVVLRPGEVPWPVVAAWRIEED